MEKEINDENLNNIPEEEHGLTADKIAHLLEHLGDEVIRDMLDSAGLDYDDPLGEYEEDETTKEEYVGKRFRRESEEDTDEAFEEAKEEPEKEDASAEETVEQAADEVIEEATADETDTEATVEETAAVEPETPESEKVSEVTVTTDSENTPESSEPEIAESKPDKPEKEGYGSSEDKAVEETKDKKATKKSSRKKRHRKVPLVRRLLFVFVLIGVLLLPLAVHFIYISATLNSDDPIQYSEHVDEVSCLDGVLKVNNVDAPVPTDGTEEYSISYSWAEEDEQYPSVPHAITAIYKGSEGERKYSISLYRNETIPTAEIAEGRNADNWFDEWDAPEDKETVQAPLQFDNIKGFYISPKTDPDDPDAPPEYDNYSFYFAVQDADGVSIYVLEGVCIDEQYHKEFAGIMEKCIQGITINMPDSEQS